MGGSWDACNDEAGELLQESEQGSSERAWLALLNKGTLAEVLRRYLDSRLRVISELFSPGVSEAASEPPPNSLGRTKACLEASTSLQILKLLFDTGRGG